MKKVDTNGAGDAFAGALALALAEGQSLVEAASFAHAAAALAATSVVEAEDSECGRSRPAETGGSKVRICIAADRAAFEEFFLKTLNA